MKENKKSSFSVEKQGLGKIKSEERKDWKSIALIWSGGVVCVPALMVGCFITLGLGFTSSIFAMAFGYLIVVSYMLFMAMQSQDLGVPSVIAFEGPFGKAGAKMFASSIVLICYTCWFGFQTAICGAAFSGLLAMYGINIPVWISMFIWGVIMFSTAIYGFGLMKILNMISVPAMVSILAYATIRILSNPVSFDHILNFVPEQPISFISGVGLAVGGFAAGGVLAGNLTRYAKSRKETCLAVSVGVLPAGIATLAIGAILAINAGASGMDNDSLIRMLTSIGAPIFGLIVLILATWTTNVSNAYSAGFALLSITKWADNKRSLCCLIVGVSGTLLAVFGMLDYFSSFLGILGAFIPTIAGVTIMDYWIIRKGKVENWNPMTKVNYAGFIAWVVGSVAALSFPKFFIPAINGLVVSSMCYYILYKMIYKEDFSDEKKLVEE